MEPGHFAVRSWISIATPLDKLHDSLTLYDGGDKQGFLYKEATGKTNWIVFQVDYRLRQEDGTILEGCRILHETSAPLHYFSKETLPAKLQKYQGHWLLLLPQSQVLISLSDRQVFPQLSLPLLPKVDEPVSHGLPKSGSSKPIGERRLSQNKNRTLPTGKVLSSLNLNVLSPHLSPVLTKQEESLQQSLLTYHNGHESSESLPWSSLAQQSPYSRPPPELAKELAGLI